MLFSEVTTSLGVVAQTSINPPGCWSSVSTASSVTPISFLASSNWLLSAQQRPPDLAINRA